MSDLDANDVISMNPRESFTKTITFQNSELKDAIKRHLGNELYFWLDSGVQCQVLKTTGGGWKKGRMRLRLEFIPDEPEVPEQPKSVLDDLRSQIDQPNQ